MKKEYRKIIDGGKGHIVATLEYKSLGQAPYFSVTGVTYTHPKNEGDKHIDCCGCIHDQISKHFPELREAIQYHLVSEEQPLHYVANTVFWYEVASGLVKYREYTNFDALEAARSAAIWPDLQLGLDIPTL